MQNALKVDLALYVYINYVLEDGIVEIEKIVLERCNCCNHWNCWNWNCSWKMLAKLIFVHKKYLSCQVLMNITGTCCSCLGWACRGRWGCPSALRSPWDPSRSFSLQNRSKVAEGVHDGLEDRFQEIGVAIYTKSIHKKIREDSSKITTHCRPPPPKSVKQTSFCSPPVIKILNVIDSIYFWINDKWRIYNILQYIPIYKDHDSTPPCTECHQQRCLQSAQS